MNKESGSERLAHATARDEVLTRKEEGSQRREKSLCLTCVEQLFHLAAVKSRSTSNDA